MFELRESLVRFWPDIASFVKTINCHNEQTVLGDRLFFDTANSVFVTRAPGRLDVMGGIADYSGSLVLQMPIQEAAKVALQRNDSDELRIISLREDVQKKASEFLMPMSHLQNVGQPITYESAKQYFQRHGQNAWAAYIAGAFIVLAREKGARFEGGANILIQSHVPEGKGVSSSAALEVATMKAVAAAFKIEIDARELAILCQKVENLVVGAPCGVMDQMSAACGEKNQLLALLCQPAEILGNVSIPPHLRVWGIDSGIRHAVSGSDYGSVRVGTFMGYRIIEQLSGHNWGGYLANISVSQFAEYMAHLPDRLWGSEFLKQYGQTSDKVTSIDPDKEYAIKLPTAHPVFEHFRVQTFRELLTSDTDDSSKLLGELMYQSHASYSACGLGSDGTDEIVSLVRQAGMESGLYGAKITGGGSGGTVAVLGKADAESAVREIACQYEKKSGHKPHIFSGSSPGAAVFDFVELLPCLN